MSPRPSDDLDTTRPFSRAAALAAGITPAQLRGPRFRRIFTSVYVDATVPVTPPLRVEAALVPFHPRAYASHASAARMYGVPLPTMPEEHVTVLDPDHRRSRDGVRCHVAPDGLVRAVDGVRVSDYAQMFVELGELLTLVDLVVVGDHLVRRGHVTLSELRSSCARSTMRGAVLARRAASYVRERVDSPMETRLRMLIVLAGLPEPVVNLTVRDDSGVPVRRYDLCWPASRTIAEYDGRPHVERVERWEADLGRREAIDDDQWRILVVVAHGIFVDPESTVLKIWRVLRERGEPGVPQRLSDDWRPHFPGRR